MLVEVPVDSIQHLFCVKIVHLGSWTDPVFELFSPTADGEPTHLHVYKLTKFKEGLLAHRFALPSTLKTCSRDLP